MDNRRTIYYIEEQTEDVSVLQGLYTRCIRRPCYTPDPDRTRP